jgi:hypothetical protein
MYASGNGTLHRKTYTIRDLLPTRPVRPLSFISKAVDIDIDKSLASLDRQLGQEFCTVAELLNRLGSIAIHDNISLGHQLLESLAAFWRLEIELGSVLAHISVNLEKWHITQVRAGDLEHVGTILSENPRHDGTCNDSAQLQHLDARQEPLWISSW